MVDFRLEKFNNTLKKIIGESISNLEDYSYFSMISIMRVETSKDLSYSKVYVSVFEESNKKSEEIILRLNDNSFYFQKMISSKIRTSRIPKIKFFIDKSSEFQREIDELIDEVYFEK